MKTNWKAKLQTVLKTEKTEMFAEKELTKTDKTPNNLVLSAFVSSELANISKNIGKNEAHLPNCKSKRTSSLLEVRLYPVNTKKSAI